MWAFLKSVEETDFATWLREGDFISDPFSTFYVLLAFHGIGMAIVVGVCGMLSLRLFGFQQGMTIEDVNKLMRVAWWGFYINLISGILLYVAQPRRELMTAVYWLKMASIVLAVIAMKVIQNALDKIETVPSPDGTGTMEIVPARARNAALLVNLLWFFAIVSGRLIGYTQPPPPY